MEVETTLTGVPEKARARFWGKVNKNGPIPEHRPELGPCWIYTGALDKHGYGRFSVSTGKAVFAHRFAYEVEVGPIDKEIFGKRVDILHACDNPPCVRPTHLLMGMHSENMEDMDAKGRRGFNLEAAHATRRKYNTLPFAEILARYTGGETSAEIAATFSCEASTIQRLFKRRGVVLRKMGARTGRAQSQETKLKRSASLKLFERQHDPSLTESSRGCVYMRRKQIGFSL